MNSKIEEQLEQWRTKRLKVLQTQRAEKAGRWVPERELQTIPGCLGDMLLCPCCGNEYLHHITVDVYERSEDAEICRVTTVTPEETLIQKTNGLGNPSFRRHGTVTRFVCENCGAKSEMGVASHKGNTFVTHSCLEQDNEEVAK
jgi:hypothetical protein